MSTDTPYIIGTIRSLETGFLGADEYQRICDTPTTTDAVHVLTSTPYRAWIKEPYTVPDALAATQSYLEHTQEWLVQTLGNRNVIAFLHTRYDALNILSALLDWQQHLTEPAELSDLGSVHPSAIQAVIWREVSSSALSDTWQSIITKCKESAPDPQDPKNSADWKNTIQETIATAALDLLRRQATTDLEKWYLKFLQLRTESIRNIGTQSPTTNFELKWDTQLIEKLRQYRSQPTGTEAILAFWLALEIETKTLRILLTGKSQGLPSNSLKNFIRPLFRSFT